MGLRSKFPCRCMSSNTEFVRIICRGGHGAAASSRISSKKYGSKSPSSREMRNQPRALSSAEDSRKRQKIDPIYK